MVKKVLFTAFIIGFAASICRPQSLQELIRDLNSGKKSKQITAAEAICKMGPKAKDAIPSLLPLLSNVDLTWYVPRALASIGKDALPKLIEGLKSKETHYLWGVTAAIALLGKEAKDAVPALLKALESHPPPSTVYNSILSALDNIGPDAKDAVPVVLKHLKNHYKDFKNNMPAQANQLSKEAKTLGAIGPAAKEAIPILNELTVFEEERFKNKAKAKNLKLSARFALYRITLEKTHIHEISSFLKSPHLSIRARAARLLAHIGPKAAGAVPSIEKLLSDKEDNGTSAWENVISAHYALGMLKENKSEHVEALKHIRMKWVVRRFFRLTCLIDLYLWRLDRKK